MQLSDQESARRENLEEARALGINPYPAEAYPVSHLATDVLKGFPEQPDNFKMVVLAGRIMMKRIMGKASFAELQDSSGRMQLYISRDEICPGEDKSLYNLLFKKILDIGDFIGVSGYIFTTQTGEITLHVQELKLLSKSLKPLPVVKT